MRRIEYQRLIANQRELKEAIRIVLSVPEGEVAPANARAAPFISMLVGVESKINQIEDLSYQLNCIERLSNKEFYQRELTKLKEKQQ